MLITNKQKTIIGVHSPILNVEFLLMQIFLMMQILYSKNRIFVAFLAKKYYYIKRYFEYCVLLNQVIRFGKILALLNRTILFVLLIMIIQIIVSLRSSRLI